MTNMTKQLYLVIWLSYVAICSTGRISRYEVPTGLEANRTARELKPTTSQNIQILDQHDLRKSLIEFLGQWIPGEKFVYFFKEIFLGGNFPIWRVFSAIHSSIQRKFVNDLNAIRYAINYIIGVLMFLINVILTPLRLVVTPLRRLGLPGRIILLPIRFFAMIGINVATYWAQGRRTYAVNMRRRLHRFLSVRNGAFSELARSIYTLMSSTVNLPYDIVIHAVVGILRIFISIILFPLRVVFMPFLGIIAPLVVLWSFINHVIQQSIS